MDGGIGEAFLHKVVYPTLLLNFVPVLHFGGFIGEVNLGINNLEHVAVVTLLSLDGWQVRVVGPGPVNTEAIFIPALAEVGCDLESARVRPGERDCLLPFRLRDAEIHLLAAVVPHKLGRKCSPRGHFWSVEWRHSGSEDSSDDTRRQFSK